MIKAGEWHTAGHRGRFRIEKVVELSTPAVSHTDKWGETSFRPVLAEIQWENGDKELWFPYFIGPVGKERYAQFAPMVSESQFMELVQGAISQGFFSSGSLGRLKMVIARAVGERLASG